MAVPPAPVLTPAELAAGAARFGWSDDDDLVVTQPHVIASTLQRKDLTAKTEGDFREALHPRDGHGRFVSIGEHVHGSGGVSGTIVSTSAGKVSVRDAAGKVTELDSHDVTKTSGPVGPTRAAHPDDLRDQDDLHYAGLTGRDAAGEPVKIPEADRDKVSDRDLLGESHAESLRIRSEQAARPDSVSVISLRTGQVSTLTPEKYATHVEAHGAPPEKDWLVSAPTPEGVDAERQQARGEAFAKLDAKSDDADAFTDDPQTGFGIGATQQEREQAKREVVDKLTARMASVPDEILLGPRSPGTTREDAVNRYVQSWSATSNDADPLALGMQEEAADLFGLDGVSDWDADVDTSDVHATEGPAIRAFLSAQYAETQEYLAAHGAKTVTLVRGQRLDPSEKNPDWAEVGEHPVTMRPMSSWTNSAHVAGIFGDRYKTPGQEPRYITAEVPASRILSMPRTGQGCLDEAEFVLLGGSIDATVTDSVGDSDDSSIFGLFDMPDPDHDTIEDDDE